MSSKLPGHDMMGQQQEKRGGSKEPRQELSGAFSSEDKWHATWRQLENPNCSLLALRLYHTTPEQVERTGQALELNNSVQVLELANVETRGCAALAVALQAHTVLCNLTIGELADPLAASALAPGLAAWRCGSERGGGALSVGAMTSVGTEHVASALASGASSGLGCLELTGCRLDDAAGAALGSVLGALPALAELRLKCATLQGGDKPSLGDERPISAPANALSAALLQPGLCAHALTRLDLSGTALSSPEAAAALAIWLGGGGAPVLQELVLAGCGLGNAGAAAIAPVLVHRGAAALMRLDMSDNGVGAVGAAALGAVLCCWPSGSGTSSDISISRGGEPLGATVGGRRGCVPRAAVPTGVADGSRGLRLGCGAESQGLGASSGALELLLCSNPLGAEGLEALFCTAKGPCSSPESAGTAATGHCAVLAALNLAGCGLRNLAPLAAVLGATHGCTLQSLDLSGNELDDAAAEALAEGLLRNSSLASLNLSCNWLGDRGGRALATALRAHPALAVLELAHCRLRNAGVEALGDAALANQAVLRLELSANRATSRLLDTTMGDIARALAERARRRRASHASGSGSTSSSPAASRRASGCDMECGGLPGSGAGPGRCISCSTPCGRDKLSAPMSMSEGRDCCDAPHAKVPRWAAHSASCKGPGSSTGGLSGCAASACHSAQAVEEDPLVQHPSQLAGRRVLDREHHGTALAPSDALQEPWLALSHAREVSLDSWASGATAALAVPGLLVTAGPSLSQWMLCNQLMLPTLRTSSTGGGSLPRSGSADWSPTAAGRAAGRMGSVLRSTDGSGERLQQGAARVGSVPGSEALARVSCLRRSSSAVAGAACGVVSGAITVGPPSKHSTAACPSALEAASKARGVGHEQQGGSRGALSPLLAAVRHRISRSSGGGAAALSSHPLALLPTVTARWQLSAPESVGFPLLPSPYTGHDDEMGACAPLLPGSRITLAAPVTPEPTPRWWAAYLSHLQEEPGVLVLPPAQRAAALAAAAACTAEGSGHRPTAICAMAQRAGAKPWPSPNTWLRDPLDNLRAAASLGEVTAEGEGEQFFEAVTLQ